jgi:hypothetical protein
VLIPATPVCSWASKIVDRRGAHKRNPATIVRTGGLRELRYSAPGGAQPPVPGYKRAVAVLLALPVAFLAALNTTFNRGTYLLA